MQFDSKAFGSRLQETRKSRNLTQEQLAEYAGLSTHYIGNIEQAVRKPSLSSILRICGALGVTPDYLLADSISQEMLDGISVCFSTQNTLRENALMLNSLFGDFLPLADEDADALWYMRIPDTVPSTPEFSSLFDDILSFPE